MKLFALGISIFLVIVGAYASRRYQLEHFQEVKQEVLSESEENGTQESTPSPSFSSPTPKSTQPAPKEENPAPSSISEFFFPGATVKSQSQSAASLESSEDVGKITNWYKEKINSQNMNAVSFVTTTANDNVINQLEAASGGESVSVEIKKEPGSSTSVINISISP